MSFARWTPLVALLLFAVAASAGTIHPRLQAEMDQTAPDMPISVIVHLTEQAPIAAIDQELKLTNATRQERHRQVVEALQATSQSSQGPLRAHLDERVMTGSVLGYTSYWISNLMVVYLVNEEIEELAQHPDVDLIEPNFKAELIEPVGFIPQIETGSETGGLRGIGVTPGLRAIRAPEVWYDLGYTGAGTLMGGCDTGVHGSHAAYSTRWRGYGGAHPWEECWLDVLGTGTSFPTDTHGHGTHVMGTQTGLGAATEDTVGVSWGSQWIACNAINQGVSSGFDNDIITSYEWFADPDGNPGTTDDVPDVVQNSWRINEGFPGDYTDCDDRWWNVIDNCEAAGVVTTWSAGNEGSQGSETIGSPADRATTLTNAFSVGAVDATNYGWPYPIAYFSSLGPTGCNVPADRKFKPEVVAPGVEVYSSVRSGGYEQAGWDGTSMSGPHVAGIVGLMREANPNLGVDDIKQILMETARDEGAAGEDNTFGWGFVDAYAAVIAATVGFGEIQGYVYNSSWSDTPIDGAEVEVVNLGNRFDTDIDGFYQGSIQAGLHLVKASHPSFAPESLLVDVVSSEVTFQNFSLTDIAGPTITEVTEDHTTTDTAGPYRIEARVEDHSTVAEVQLYYRVNGGAWVPLSLTPYIHDISLCWCEIPGKPVGTQIDYYIWAEDGIGLTSTSPDTAPDDFYSLYITNIMYAYDAETVDNDWQLGAAGDDATTGIWIRDDPVGTDWPDGSGTPVQPEDDHTPTPGVNCFVTGNANPGDGAGTNDVDGGCTTLLSPIFDLSEATLGFVSYHRWYGENGNSTDDEFAVDVSGDGGYNWYPLERVVGNEAEWQKLTFNISDVLGGLTDQIQFRFVACDLNTGGLVEAGIDDFAIETFIPMLDDVEDLDVRQITGLRQNEPNPFGPATRIKFTLSNPGQANLQIFDASGRLVRTLVDSPMTSGTHQILWDGLDDQGHEAGSGVYFYKLKVGAFEQCRRMTILR